MRASGPVVLTAPTALSDEAWAAVTACHQRLDRAQEVGDRSLAIGCAKELVECVAKLVLAASGRTAGANTDFGSLLTEAHKCLDRQPGVGLAQDEPARSLAQGAKSLITSLGHVRNVVGTGHGRVTEPVIADEVIELAVPAALLWCRWALRRLDHLMVGSIEPLIADVAGPGIFSRDVLTRRLAAAGLAALSPDDLRRLGQAVGQRALSGTFMVRIEGAEACADSDDLVNWPPEYRIALATGLFLDRDGYLAPEPWSARLAARVLAALPDQQAAVLDLLITLESAPLSYALSTRSDLRSAVEADMSEAARILTASAQASWAVLRRRFLPPAGV